MVGGVPYLTDDLGVRTRAHYGPGGAGIRFGPSLTGVAYVQAPVRVADGSSLEYIQLRADCSKNAPVKAELVAISPTGEVKSLGSVSTEVPDGGFFAQVRSNKLKSPVTIDHGAFVYVVRVTLSRNDLSSDPAAYEVMVAPRCNPGGPMYCPPGPEPEPLRWPPRPPRGPIK